MTEQRSVVVLGSTGSVGTQTIDVIRAAPDRFRAVAVCAGGSDVAALAAQAAGLRVRAVGIGRDDLAGELRDRLDAIWPADAAPPQIVAGPAAATELATFDADVVLNAVAGAQGLRATLAALDAGRTVALANKESLIAGGSLVTQRARPGQIVPVDSEHSALAQCLRAGRRSEVRRLVLTASGGPFRGRARATDALTSRRAEALRAPDLGHGPARHDQLRDAGEQGPGGDRGAPALRHPYDRIDVVVHPQSIVHSMVEFVDGSTIAQASPPDMRLPIALAWTGRTGCRAPRRPSTGRDARELDVRAPRRRGVPGRRAGPRGGSRRAAAHRPSSTPRMRNSSPRSTPGRSVSSTSSRRWPMFWTSG